MAIPEGFNEIMSWLGMPTVAGGLAVGLVRGARALEADASEAALRYISGLLVEGSPAGLSKLAAAYIPNISTACLVLGLSASSL